MSRNRRELQSRRHPLRFDQLAVARNPTREAVEANVTVHARRDQIAIAEQGVQVAVQSYELNLDRIKEAKGLPIEVLQSVQALDQARREYLRTIIDYNTAQFSLLRALGWPD